MTVLNTAGGWHPLLQKTCRLSRLECPSPPSSPAPPRAHLTAARQRQPSEPLRRRQRVDRQAATAGAKLQVRLCKRGHLLAAEWLLSLLLSLLLLCGQRPAGGRQQQALPSLQALDALHITTRGVFRARE